MRIYRYYLKCCYFCEEVVFDNKVMIGMILYGLYIVFLRVFFVFDKSVVYKYIVLKEEFYYVFDMKMIGGNILFKNVYVLLFVKINIFVVFEFVGK